MVRHVQAKPLAVLEVDPRFRDFPNSQSINSVKLMNGCPQKVVPNFRTEMSEIQSQILFKEKVD